MDPNTMLARIRELLKTAGETDPLELRDAVRDLDGWLTRGAYFPDAWEKSVQNYLAEFDRQHDDVNQALLAEHAADEDGCCKRCADWDPREPGGAPEAGGVAHPCRTVQLVQSRQPNPESPGPCGHTARECADIVGGNRKCCIACEGHR